MLMYVALSTGSLYKYSLDEVFQIASIAGFDGIELLIEKRNYNIGLNEIQDLSNKYGIPILNLHSPFMFLDGWGELWDSIWKSMLMAIELSIPLLNFHPPVGIFPRHRLTENFSLHIRSCKEYSKGSNMTLTIENLPTLRVFRQLRINRLSPRLVNNMYDLVEFSIANEIQITFDTTHVGTTGVPLLEAYSAFKSRIANIHLSDFDGESQHLLPGKGYLPLKDLLSQVKQDGYNGIITLETHPEAMEYENKSKALRNAERSLKYIVES